MDAFDEFNFAGLMPWRVCPVCAKEWNWGNRFRQAQDPFSLCVECRSKEIANYQPPPIDRSIPDES